VYASQTGSWTFCNSAIFGTASAGGRVRWTGTCVAFGPAAKVAHVRDFMIEGALYFLETKQWAIDILAERTGPIPGFLREWRRRRNTCKANYVSHPPYA
jgi:hypothetical protein